PPRLRPARAGGLIPHARLLPARVEPPLADPPEGGPTPPARRSPPALARPLKRASAGSGRCARPAALGALPPERAEPERAAPRRERVEHERREQAIQRVAERQADVEPARALAGQREHADVREAD